MSTVKFYDNYPTILPPTDTRLADLKNVEALRINRNLYIATTLVLSVGLIVVFYHIKKEQDQRKNG